MMRRQPIVEAIDGTRVRVAGRWMLNFAATNYLGLNDHPEVKTATARAVEDWGISLGMPRALALDNMTARLEQRLAHFLGQETALVFASTNHLANDVIPHLSRDKGAVFMDRWAYPSSVQAAKLAAQNGAQVRWFGHNDQRHLARLLRSQRNTTNKVVVCDGVYSAGPQLANFREIVRIAARFGAVVYVDDAHGFGVLGERPTRDMPYGFGGRGTPSHFGLHAAPIVHVASLSKAWGAPLAFAAGSAKRLNPLRKSAATFEHSSPSSSAVLAAALAALRIHGTCGESLRKNLLARICQFRRSLPGRPGSPSWFLPAQSVYYSTSHEAFAIGRTLWKRGIWPVVQSHPRDHPTGGVLRLVLTARHTPEQIRELAVKLARTRCSAMRHINE